MAVLVAAMALSVSLPPVAMAHAELDTASPGPGSVVESRPEALAATFTEQVDPAKTTMEVRDASGLVVAKGGPSDIAADRISMSFPLPPLADGVYEVRWTTSALDGHIERGTYTFTVALAASPGESGPESSPGESVSGTPSPAATQVPAASPIEGGTAAADGTAVLIPVIAALAVVGVLALWFVQRRRA